jgi:RND family efflux transporter MFP subunit
MAITARTRWARTRPVLVAIAAAGLVGACNRAPAPGGPSAKGGPGAPAAEPRTVQMVPIATRPIDRFIDVTGTLYGEEEVTIAAEVPGRIVDLAVDLGDEAPAGGRLAQVETTDYTLAVAEQRAGLMAALAKLGLDEMPEGDIDLAQVPLVARADASLANAKSRLDRARKLFERTPPMMSAQDFADIETEYAVALTSASVERLNARSLLADARVRASAVRLSEQKLTDTTVIAPTERGLTYRVASRLVSVGEVVTQGQPLFRLVATRRVKFRGAVPERFSADVRAGAPALLSLEGFEQTFDGVVARVAPAVDVTTRAFEVEIEADNADGRLKPGSFARAQIRVGTQQDARFVPDAAVAEFAGTQRVFSIKDGKAVEHRVRLGRSVNGQRELLDPLPDVTELIDRPRAIAPGAPVKVVSTS